MKKIRIGNTILAKWTIKVNGQPYPLEGLDLNLMMTLPNGEIVPLDFTIEETNKIYYCFQGKDQKHLGKYRLTLWQNEGDDNQHVVDACDAWSLVSCSCKTDDGATANLELEVVELEGNLEVGEGGLIKAVLYTPQTLTDEEKAQARANINAKKGGYTRIEKLHDYIHEVWYDGVDYSLADMLPHTTLGGCTSIRKGKFFARNLDWQYSEAAEFFVHTPAADGRHAVDGFGGNIPSLTKEVVESGAWHPAYQWLPLTIADGHNDAGLCASMNVVPTKTAPNTYEKTTGTNPSKPTLNGLMIVRYILDNHTDALSAAQDIANNWNVVMPHTETFDQELHFLIADKTRTIVLEFVGNEAVIIQKANQEGYITNFRLNGVDETSIVTMVDTIEPFGQGVERYGMIKQSITTPENIAAALLFMPYLWYTNAYTREGYDAWLTDFAGLHDELTVHAAAATPSVYDETLAAAHEAYLNRTRNGETWQTTHSVAYDIESGECVFLVQQNVETYTQRDMVSSGGGITPEEVREIINEETYQKSETDALLADKADADSVYTQGQVDTALAAKVDKVSGKGLSTNDYTNADKEKATGSVLFIKEQQLTDDQKQRAIDNIGAAGRSDLLVLTDYLESIIEWVTSIDESKADRDNTYSKSDTDEALANKEDKMFSCHFGTTTIKQMRDAYNSGKKLYMDEYGIHILVHAIIGYQSEFRFTRLYTEDNSVKVSIYYVYGNDSSTNWAPRNIVTLCSREELDVVVNDISELRQKVEDIPVYITEAQAFMYSRERTTKKLYIKCPKNTILSTDAVVFYRKVRSESRPRREGSYRITEKITKGWVSPASSLNPDIGYALRNIRLQFEKTEGGYDYWHVVPGGNIYGTLADVFAATYPRETAEDIQSEIKLFRVPCAVAVYRNGVQITDFVTFSFDGHIEQEYGIQYLHDAQITIK